MQNLKGRKCPFLFYPIVFIFYFKVLNYLQSIIVFRRVEFSKEEQKFLKAKGEVLRSLRQKSGYTSLETFANDIGMDPALYGRYERGTNIKAISLFRLLSHHSVGIDNYYMQVVAILKEQKNEEIK